MLLTPLSVSALAVPPLAQASSTTHNIRSTANATTANGTNQLGASISLQQRTTGALIAALSRTLASRVDPRRRRRRSRISVAADDDGERAHWHRWHQPPWPSIEHRRPTTRNGKDSSDAIGSAFAAAAVGRSSSSSSGSKSAVYSVINQTTSHVSVSDSFSNKSTSVYASNGVQYSETSSSSITSSSSSSNSIAPFSTSSTPGATHRNHQHLDYQRDRGAITTQSSATAVNKKHEYGKCGF